MNIRQMTIVAALVFTGCAHVGTVQPVHNKSQKSSRLAAMSRERVIERLRDTTAWDRAPSKGRISGYGSGLNPNEPLFRAFTDVVQEFWPCLHLQPMLIDWDHSLGAPKDEPHTIFHSFARTEDGCYDIRLEIWEGRPEVLSLEERVCEAIH